VIHLAMQPVKPVKMANVSLLTTHVTLEINALWRIKQLEMTVYHVYNVNRIKIKRNGVSILNVQPVPYV
jgi:hypothetical protein